MKEKCRYCDKPVAYRYKGKIPACTTHYYRLYTHGDPHYIRKTNEYKTDGEITYLKTNNGEVFKVDTEEHDKIKGSTWTANKNGGYLVARKNDKIHRLHRVLMGVEDNSKVVVDHIDGDVKNNLKENLRVVTQKHNSRNTSHHHNSEVKYPGISKNTKGDKYRVRIMVDGKEIALGTYEDIGSAKRARIKGEKKYFGEHSYHNRDKGTAY